MNCYKCNTAFEKRKFTKYCPKCKRTYGQYAHWWPIQDEIIQSTGSIVKWSQIKLYRDLRTNPTSGVPVICGHCGKERIVPCPNIKMALTNYRGKFTGYCKKCNCLPEIQKLRQGKILRKNGRMITGRGYMFINLKTLSDHEKGLARTMINKVGHGNYIAEHRLVVACKLGRPLANHERVHHLNGNKLDNRVENLMLTDKTEHNHIEVRVFNEMKDELDKANKTIILLSLLWQKHT